MRSVKASFAHPAPDSLTVEQMRLELIHNLDLSEVKAAAWTAQMTSRDIVDAGGVKSLRSQAASAAALEAGMTLEDLSLVSLLLGTASAPYCFPDVLLSKDVKCDVKEKKYKGGPTTDSAERLLTRRPRMEAADYFPPASFDPHRAGSKDRDETKLRHLVVQEMKEVAGDLYLSEQERHVILGAVEMYVGSPLLRGCHQASHWNNWRDSSGKKHKGTAIADMEKARLAPLTYGVTKQAVHGDRPPRPRRQPPPLQRAGAALEPDPKPDVAPQSHPLPHANMGVAAVTVASTMVGGDGTNPKCVFSPIPPPPLALRHLYRARTLCTNDKVSHAHRHTSTCHCASRR